MKKKLDDDELYFRLSGWLTDGESRRSIWHFYNDAHKALCGYKPKDNMITMDEPNNKSVPCEVCKVKFLKLRGDEIND